MSASVRELQERAARALPAEHVTVDGDWWLRHGSGSSWWVGTVLPHAEADGDDDLTRRVAAAEEFYAARGTPTRFQISPGACPPRLDSLLASRGYRRESPMSLQAVDLARALDGPWRPSPGGPGPPPVHDRPTPVHDRPVRVHDRPVRVEDRPGEAWFATWSAVHGHGGDPAPERALLDRVRAPSAYASVVLDGAVASVARGVADSGWVGVFGMATLPSARGRGAARSVLAALAGWGAAHGAGRMYLQVERDNVAALRLYERAGFDEVCAYHYRTRH